MGELGNKLKALVIGLAMVSCIVPVPAYASTVEDWATLNGWLASINGNIQLCYAELANIFEKMGDIESELEDIRLAGSVWTDSDIEALLNPNMNALPGGETSIRGYVRQIYYNFTNFKDAVDQYLLTLQTESEYQSDVLDAINTKWATWANAGYPVDTSVNVTVDSAQFTLDSETKTAINDIKTLVNDWKNTGYKVNTGILLTPILNTLTGPILSALVRIRDAVEGLDTKTFTVDTGLTIPSLATIENRLQNLITRWDAWRDAGYTVDTGLTIPEHPSLTGITNAVNSCKSDLESLLSAWNVWKNSGYSVDTGLTIPEHPSLSGITNAVNLCKSGLDSLLAAWNVWKNAGYTVDTGLTIPSLATIESRLQNLITRWDAWVNTGYSVTTDIDLSGLTSSFDDSRIIQAINGLKGSVDAIHSWLLLGTVADIVGNFDFSELADKSSQLLDDASDIAPFAGFALIAAMLEIWAGSGALSDPSLQFNFDFFQPGNTVTLDLSWINDGLPLVHFLMISMLILCVVNCSARIIELEATS